MHWLNKRSPSTEREVIHQEEEATLKLALRFATIVAVGVMMIGVAGANTVDQSGTWVPSDTYIPTPPAGVRALIPDGSFEQGPPPGSAWVEVTSQPCEWIGNWTAVWGVGPYHGTYDFWAGGYCNGFPTSSSVTQTVTVPADCTLSFWYISFRPDLDDVPPDGDHAYVSVNGTEVWTLAFTQANDTYPTWVNATVNLTAGASISLAFGATSVGTNTGNIRFDYIEFIPCGPTAADDMSWGTLKTLYR